MELSTTCNWRGGGEKALLPRPPRFLCCCLCLICLLSLKLLFFPSSGSAQTTISDTSGPCSTKTCTHRIQEGEKTTTTTMMATRLRRELMLGGGPGSYPPRCTTKCGECTPCRAVHVPVPPGRAVIAEYYPEAWRCKCGNRIYLP